MYAYVKRKNYRFELIFTPDFYAVSLMIRSPGSKILR